MIKSLHISNYALIDHLDIDFDGGFNIITGETGAGKSIILGALSLLMGGRADSRVVRDASRKSVTEAIFDITDAAGVADLLRTHQLDGADAGECILRREIAPGGRSRAFVNDTPVNLPVLKEIAESLVDIHSQHRNLLLANADYQLDIIDAMAGNRALLEEYAHAFDAYRKALKQYTDTRDLIQRNKDDAEFIDYQYNQLADLNLQPGEQQTLTQERELLANVNEIKDTLGDALDPLSNGHPNVLTLIHSAVDALERLSASLSDDSSQIFRALAERLDSARIEIADITDTLVEYDTSLAADPARLADVEERLGQLYTLELKHHVESADELIAIRDRLATQLAALDDSAGVLAQLENAAKRAKKVAVELAQQISQARIDAAAEFAELLRDTASPLGMPNLRCEVSITKGKLGPKGYDQLQFLVAFNKNQTLTPVGDTASGGEISRLMLAVKAIVAERMHLPSIIFDEIDTGISGNIAARMAGMMAAISRKIQVITITHLPGVAAAGTSHYKVYKEDEQEATTTRINRLDRAAREAEIALMISGVVDDASLASARSLLDKKEA